MGTNASERLGIRYEDYATFTKWAESEHNVPEDLVMEVLQGFVSGGSLKQSIKRYATNSEARTAYVLEQFSSYSLLSKLGRGEGDAGFTVESLPNSNKMVVLPDPSVENEASSKKHKATVKTEDDIEWEKISDIELDIVRRLVVIITKKYGVPPKSIYVERVSP